MLQAVMQNFACSWTAEKGEALETGAERFNCLVRRTATLARRKAVLILGNGTYNGRTFKGQLLVPSSGSVRNRHWRTEADEIFQQWCRENGD